ncbi:hypothetical protein OQA88_12153 [Cercophora sp. LCS_1]
MGSQRQYDRGQGGDNEGGGLPFGYNLDPALDFDISSLVPSSNPLLSSQESAHVHDFINSVLGCDQSMPAETFHNFRHVDDMSQFYSPPVVISHSTSYGAPNEQVLFSGLDSISPKFVAPAATMMPFQQQPTHNTFQHAPDVVAAANTLLSRQGNMQQEQLNYHPVMQHPPTPARSMPPNQPFAFQPYGVPEAQPAPQHERQYVDTSLVFAYQQPAAARRTHIPPTEAQYGSDPNFSNQSGYQPQSWNDSLEAMHTQQAMVLGCLTKNESAATTRANSPILANSALPAGNSLPYLLKTRQPAPSRIDEVQSGPSSDAELEASPGKRKASSCIEDEEVEEEQPKPKRRRPTNGSSVRRPTGKQQPNGANPTCQKQKASPRAAKSGRKCSTNKPKVPRVNLTDEEKRKNHIASEHRRRGMIKVGYDDLYRIIPELNPGMSRAATIAGAVKWVSEMLKGNERLKKQLAEARNDLIGFKEEAEQDGDRDCDYE